MKIPLSVKHRVHEADARIIQLEGLLQTWLAYCDQSGAQTKLLNMSNPVHKLIFDTRNALGAPCRNDGRCQYAIDSGAEGMGHCPQGKCVMSGNAGGSTK